MPARWRWRASRRPAPGQVSCFRSPVAETRLRHWRMPVSRPTSVMYRRPVVPSSNGWKASSCRASQRWFGRRKDLCSHQYQSGGNRMRRVLKALLPIVIAGAFALPAEAQAPKQLSIATGRTGVVYYPLGGGMANVLSKKAPAWSVTAEAPAGAVATLHMLRDGKAELALV